MLPQLQPPRFTSSLYEDYKKEVAAKHLELFGTLPTQPSENLSETFAAIWDWRKAKYEEKYREITSHASSKYKCRLDLQRVRFSN